MATKPITNISSGIYTREIDLTIQTAAAGTFAGGAIGLTSKVYNLEDSLPGWHKESYAFHGTSSEENVLDILR